MKIKHLLIFILYQATWGISISLILAFHILKQGISFRLPAISLAPIDIPLTLKENTAHISAVSLSAIRIKASSQKVLYQTEEITSDFQKVYLDGELGLHRIKIKNLSYEKGSVLCRGSKEKTPRELAGKPISLKAWLDENNSPLVSTLAKFQIEKATFNPLSFSFKDRSLNVNLKGNIRDNHLRLETKTSWSFPASRGKAVNIATWKNLHHPFELQLLGSVAESRHTPELTIENLNCRTHSKSKTLQAHCHYELHSRKSFPLKKKTQVVAAEYFLEKENLKINFPLDNLNFIPQLAAEGQLYLLYDNKWTFKLSPDAHFKILEIQKAFQLLEKQKWAFLPAPLRVLTGPLEIVPAWQDATQTLSVKTFANLASEDQTLNFESFIKVKPFSDLDLIINIKKARLVLPKLDPELKIIPDSRIVEAKPLPASKSSFKYRMQIFSENLSLYSNDYKTDIPVRFNVVQSENQSKIEVALNPFQFELFNKTAKLNSLKMSKKNSSSQFEVKGTIEIPVAEYRLFMEVLGTLERPKVVVRSEPYLTENQILSLLVLGRPMETLTSDELGTLGNAQRVLTDATFNLVTLYFLASTPIDSIQWNPDTKSIVVKIRLQDGTYVNVGSDSKKIQMLGFKQKIFKNLFFTTDVKNPFEKKDRSISSFIEWSNQY